jgi:hypothetical protein
LVGDGIDSTIIKMKFGNLAVANLCDSSFNSGALIGSGTAILPQSIEISGIKFLNQSAGIVQPIINIDSASNIRITNTMFSSNAAAGFYPNVVHIRSHASSTKSITLDGCYIVGGGNGIVNLGTGTKSINVINSTYDNLANTAIVMNAIDSISSINNYYGSVTSVSSRQSASRFISFGEVFSTGTSSTDGLYLGNLFIRTAVGTSIGTDSPVVATFIANSSGKLNYEISNSSARRFGSLTFSTDGTNNYFTDTYSESTVSVKANLYANANSLTCSLDSGTGTLKYSFTQFI